MFDFATYYDTMHPEVKTMPHMDARSGNYRYAGVSRNDPFSVDMIGTDLCAPDYRVERVHSPISVVGYTLSGAGIITQNGVTETARKGDLFVVHMGGTHEYHPLHEWEFCWVNIVGEFWKQMLSCCGLDRRIVYHNCALGEEFHRHVLASTPADVSAEDIQRNVQPFLSGLVLHLYHSAAQKEPGLPSEIRAAFDRSLHTGCTQAEICRGLGLSVRHAQRLFKEAYHQTLHQYVTERRMAAAKALLKSTGRSIHEIAADTGFGNEKHFSTAFRRLEGLSPSEYRRRG